MIYVISKSTFGSHNVRDIQCNANWTSCPYSDYARIPDDMVDGILATKGYCNITLNREGTEVQSFTARTIPSVTEECCGTNTVLSVNGVKANTDGELTLDPTDIGARAETYAYASKNGGNCNDYVTETHLFVFNMANKPSAFNYGWLDVWEATGSGFSPSGAKPLVRQRFTNWNSDSRAWRHSTDGGATWSEWAYDNPSCQDGVDYLTTERYRDMPVRTRVVNCGTISAGASITVAHKMNISYLARVEINVGRRSVPALHNGDPTNQYSVTGYVDKDNVYVKNGSGNSSYEVCAQIWYVGG